MGFAGLPAIYIERSTTKTPDWFQTLSKNFPLPKLQICVMYLPLIFCSSLTINVCWYTSKVPKKSPFPQPKANVLGVSL